MTNAEPKRNRGTPMTAILANVDIVPDGDGIASRPHRSVHLRRRRERNDA